MKPPVEDVSMLRSMWAHAQRVNGLAEVAVDCQAVRRMGWPDAGGAVGVFRRWGTLVCSCVPSRLCTFLFGLRARDCVSVLLLMLCFSVVNVVFQCCC